jgi:hypothetical protein
MEPLGLIGLLSPVIGAVGVWCSLSRRQSRQARRRAPMRSRSGGWIDVTAPLRDGVVRWPDNPPVRITRMFDLERGDDYTASAFSCGVHAGTHMDAPLHFIRRGHGLDAMALSAFMGPARVIEILDRESIKPDLLRAHRLKRGRTGSVQDPQFFPPLEDKPLSPKLRLSQRRGRSVVGRASCTHGRDRLLVGRRLCLGHRRHSLRAAQGGDLNHRGIESVEGPARALRIALPTDQDGAVRRRSRPCAPESPARQAPDQIRPSVKEGLA